MRIINTVVRVDDRHKVLFVERLEIEQQFLDQLEILVLFVGHGCKEGRERIDHD